MYDSVILYSVGLYHSSTRDNNGKQRDFKIMKQLIQLAVFQKVRFDASNFSRNDFLTSIIYLFLLFGYFK